MSYYTFVVASILAVIGWWYALPPFPQVTEAIAQWCSYPQSHHWRHLCLCRVTGVGMVQARRWEDGVGGSEPLAASSRSPTNNLLPTAKFNEGLNPRIRWQEWGEGDGVSTSTEVTLIIHVFERTASVELQ